MLASKPMAACGFGEWTRAVPTIPEKVPAFPYRLASRRTRIGLMSGWEIGWFSRFSRTAHSGRGDARRTSLLARMRVRTRRQCVSERIVTGERAPILLTIAHYL